MNDQHAALAGYPVVLTIPVQWGDQDAFGHVNNRVYLKWCETARVEYLVRIGQFPKLPPEGVGPILANLSCDYRRPLTYPDEVQVGARISKIGNASLRMDHVIVSRREGEVAAEASSVLVLLDYASGKTVRVPEVTRRTIRALEAAAKPAI
jgi:acyl-CoA thioester hydrolase